MTPFFDWVYKSVIKIPYMTTILGLKRVAALIFHKTPVDLSVYKQ